MPEINFPSPRQTNKTKNKAKQSKVKQIKAKQSKAKQSKAKQEYRIITVTPLGALALC